MNTEIKLGPIRLNEDVFILPDYKIAHQKIDVFMRLMLGTGVIETRWVKKRCVHDGTMKLFLRLSLEEVSLLRAENHTAFSSYTETPDGLWMRGHDAIEDALRRLKRSERRRSARGRKVRA